jgi:hypothetical protein
MSEDTITISKADLQQLIREGIAQAVSPNHDNAIAMFNGLKVTFEDIGGINDRHGITSGGLHNTQTYSRRLDSWGRRNGPSANEIHDQLRKLSLAIVGETKNKDVTHYDYKTVRDAYLKFRDLFFDLYDERAESLSKEFIHGRD